MVACSGGAIMIRSRTFGEITDMDKAAPYESDLVNAQGVPRFGVIDQPVGRVNYLDYDLRSPMDRPRGRLARYLGFNQFQFIGLCGPEFIAGVAVVDLRLVGNAFAYVFDFKTRKLEEFSCLAPLALGTSIPATPDDGESRCRRGKADVRIQANAAVRSRDVQVKVPGRLEVFSQMREPKGYKPLRVCARAGYTGWVFTQKAAGLPVSGQLVTPTARFELDEQCRASYDWSCGFMRRETAWNWTSLSVRLPDGRSLGLNLAAGVNETSVTENAYWLDNRMVKLAMACFDFDRYQPDETWRVRTSDGLVDLEFQPLGCRREKINVGILASNFRQFFGYYSGIIRTPEGEQVQLEKVPGFAEDHYAKW